MTSLTISKLTRKWDRRSVMLGLTFLMILSGIIITFAHNSILFMLGRAILGIVIGGFWSMSTAIVIRLVPFNDVPKALGLLNGDNALATTIAAPLGSFLSSMIGWRGAFFCIVPIALLWQVKTMPSLSPIKIWIALRGKIQYFSSHKTGRYNLYLFSKPASNTYLISR